jgi:RNA polymerase sigma-70 factor (ECF subfamily)
MDVAMSEPPTPNAAGSSVLQDRIAAVHPELVGFLRRRVGDDAEEVAQDVWVKITAVDPAVDDLAGFRSYVFVVARRLLIDRYRSARSRKARLQVVPLADSPEVGRPPDAHSTVAAGEAAALVERTLDGIKPELVEVFWMRTREDLPFKEIAKRQSTSVNTALGRMHQVVKKLKAAMAAEGWS